MKKFLAMLMILTMVAGCAGLQNYFCTPDENQVTQSQKNLAAAQAALNVLSPLTDQYVEAKIAVVALNLAIPIFNMVVSGICVTYEQFKSALDAVDSANTAAIKIGVGRQLDEQRASKGLMPVTVKK